LKRLAQFLTLLALCATWTACAQATAGSPAPVARQYLWEVSSLTNRIYLFGTVHAGKASFFPLAEPVQKAFADATVLAVEADILNTEAMAKSAPSMLLTPPDRLDKRISAPVYERYRKQLDRFGIPETQTAQLKPFIASSILAFAEWGRLGYRPIYGVDRHLLARARDEKKTIVELEGVEAQAALIDSLTDEESRRALEGTVAALESGLTREQITGMVNAWESGNPDLLLEVARAYNESVPGARELEEKFIWSRHEAMADRIEEWLMRGRERVFVAVGALHLAGPRGLVEMLGKRGYQVRQL
jgi:uncharacterized protein YbaP (TraB family)